MLPGGGIVVDDCRPGPYDGSLQAYEEFLAEHGMTFERVGSKGGVLRKPLEAETPRVERVERMAE